MKDKAVAIGLGVGVSAAVLMWLLVGANDGMHGRMNWMLAGAWMAGGREGVAAVIGLAAGALAWLFSSK